MKSFYLGLPLALCLAACSPSAPPPKAVAADCTIVIDPTASFGAYTDPAFAKSLAAAVWKKLRDSDLRPGDSVVIRYLGRSGPRELMSERLTLDRTHSKRDVLNEVYRRIANLPNRSDVGQDTTNLLHVLQNTDFGCHDGKGAVIVLTDGLPADKREFTNWRGLIAGTAKLPKPTHKAYAQCAAVVMIGLGVQAEGLEPIPTNGIDNIEKEWRAFSVGSGLSDPSKFHAVRSL